MHVGLLSRVLAQVKRRPLIVNCVTYGSIAGLAELTQQTLAGKPGWGRDKNIPGKGEAAGEGGGELASGYNWESVGRYTIIGSCLFSPVLHYWYRWLDCRLPGTSLRTVLIKTTVDVAVLDIPLYSLFYVALNLMEGQSLQYLREELKVKLLPTVIIGAVFWFPAQIINFRFLPPHARVVYIALCTFVEVNILCILKKMELGTSTSEAVGQRTQ